MFNMYYSPQQVFPFQFPSPLVMYYQQMQMNNLLISRAYQLGQSQKQMFTSEHKDESLRNSIKEQETNQKESSESLKEIEKCSIPSDKELAVVQQRSSILVAKTIKKKKKQIKKKIPLIKKVNEAKNIPKNTMKAIVKYINSKYDEILIMFENDSVKCFDFINKVESDKKRIFSCNQLKQMWSEGYFETPLELKLFKQYRYLLFISIVTSSQFLKTHYISYLYNSKIQQTKIHLKCRHKLIRIINSVL